MHLFQIILQFQIPCGWYGCACVGWMCRHWAILFQTLHWTLPSSLSTPWWSGVLSSFTTPSITTVTRSVIWITTRWIRNIGPGYYYSLRSNKILSNCAVCLILSLLIHFVFYFQLELKKMLLDRMVNLLSRGCVVPVLRYIKQCWQRGDTDISLIRYFITEVHTYFFSLFKLLS